MDWMAEVDPFQWVTMLLACFATVLSTITFFVHRADRKRTVQVSHGYGFVSSDPDDQKLILQAAAPREPVTLVGAGLRLPDGQTVFSMVSRQPGGQLPKRLQGGDGHSELMSLRELRAELLEQGLTGRVRLRPFFNDALGRSHFGSRFAIEIGSACGPKRAVRHMVTSRDSTR